MLHKVILIGRLTKDIELRHTTNGTAVESFTLSVDRPFTTKDGKKETDFINCQVWRKQAENCAQYIGKGSLVAVEGRIQVRNYEAKDGIRKYVTEVVCDNVRFLDSKKSKPTETIEGEEINISEEDVPF